MQSYRKSIMDSLSDEDFAKVLCLSTSYADLVRKLGLRIQGSNYSTIKKRIVRQNLSISHFNPNWKNGVEKNKIPTKNLLIENCSYNISSNDLKKRLIKEEILEYKCVKCKNIGEWNNKPLTLQLDHINGNHKDNRLENLQILCPNCHTQTDTHSGKRLKKIYICPSCKSPYGGYGKICRKCQDKKLRISKITWPDKEVLKKMIWSDIQSSVAHKIGCSVTSLRDYCLENDIPIPQAGYWIKRKNGMSHEEAISKKIINNISKKEMSEEQIKIAFELSKSGMTNRNIGIKLGFHHTTIGRNLKNLAYKL